MTLERISTTNKRLDDSQIRESLRFILRDECSKHNDVMLIEELGVFQGDFRVDLATVNGHIHGYEIKSDVDTLSRLSSQVKAYSSIFQYLTVVVGQRHLAEVRKKLPKFCGLMLATYEGSEVTLKEVRKPKKNCAIEPSAMIQLLWRDESLALLELLGHSKGIKSKPRQVLWDKLVQIAKPREIQSFVTETIKKRTSWRVDLPHA